VGFEAHWLVLCQQMGGSQLTVGTPLDGTMEIKTREFTGYVSGFQIRLVSTMQECFKGNVSDGNLVLRHGATWGG
jgi:hypothetical protein